jgi:phage baseplate assembly protein V
MARELLEALRKAVQPLKVRITNMIARGVIKLVTDDTLLQTLQVDLSDDEAPDEDLHPDVPHYQQYGFTSVPQLDNGTAEAIVLFIGGDRSNPVAIATGDMAYRLAGLQPGEVALYTDEDNPDGDPEVDRHFILLKRGRITVLKADEIHLGADDQGVVIDGKLKAYIDDQIRAVFNAHTHAPGTFTTATGGPVTGVSGAPSATIAAAGDIASSKAKAAE